MEWDEIAALVAAVSALLATVWKIVSGLRGRDRDQVAAGVAELEEDLVNLRSALDDLRDGGDQGSDKAASAEKVIK